jgi:hypothetical protein
MQAMEINGFVDAREGESEKNASRGLARLGSMDAFSASEKVRNNPEVKASK